MPVRLSKKLWVKRTIPLGLDVTMTFRRFGYAEYKAAEAMAHRRARDAVETVNMGLVELEDGENLPLEAEADLIGKASEILIDTLVLKYADGWTGVFDDDAPEGEEIPLPLTSENWAMFRSCLPMCVDRLQQSLVMLHQMVDQEGKDYAPLPGTGIQGG